MQLCLQCKEQEATMYGICFDCIRENSDRISTGRDMEYDAMRDRKGEFEDVGNADGSARCDGVNDSDLMRPERLKPMRGEMK